MRFGGLTAFRRSTSTSIRARSSSVIGPNGAGKTTLFSVITGRVRPTQGEVLLRGEALTGRPPFAVAQAGVVRTFQKTEVFGAMPLQDGVAAGALARRDPGSRGPRA